MNGSAGGLAQLVERLLCKQDVSGSSPLTSMPCLRVSEPAGDVCVLKEDAWEGSLEKSSLVSSSQVLRVDLRVTQCELW